jgi:hypothetical protein
MKMIIRSLVIALAVTGAIASKTSAMPVPSCPPSDPNGCGITGW